MFDNKIAALLIKGRSIEEIGKYHDLPDCFKNQAGFSLLNNQSNSVDKTAHEELSTIVPTKTKR